MLASSSQETYTPEDLITGNKEPVTAAKTVASGAGVVAKLTVMGIVTASGKAIPSLSAATDGSEVPDHILVEEVDASSADVVAPAYVEGYFNPDLLVIGSGHTVASITEPLRQRGIHLRKPL